MPGFVHLHVHSEYSLVDGLIRIDALAEAAAADAMPALALTEHGNLFSAVKFYREAIAHGIKPVLGAEIRVVDDTPGQNPAQLLLLCQDQQGYRNLVQLITRSYQEGQRNNGAFVPRRWLHGHCGGLIALSGARDGDVGQALVNGNTELAKTLLAEWLKLFPDRYYLELQRTGRPNEERYIDGAVRLAEAFSVPVAASNDVRFLERGDFEAHEARVCIHEGRLLNDPRRPRRYSPEQYFKSGVEMVELFRDLPEALENTALIAQRCNLELSLGEYHLPVFQVPAGHDQDSWLRNEAERGLAPILERVRQSGAAPELLQQYRDRLAHELSVITTMGFAGYFLIVADFIRWAKTNDIPVGPGRGSGAGSLVAYALDITELDPIRYELLFERFLNPERISLPDFDVDFCMERRDDVIDYVSERYGRDRVSQIITYGSMAAKAVVRDVGRVLGHPYGFVDKIAKLIPFDLNMTLERALQEEDALRQSYEDEEEVRALIDLARRLEGLARNAGRHAGGIVIAPRPLIEYMPLYCEQGSQATVTQFDMGDVEAIGLVKFDFLGLRTLTIIDWALRDVNRVRAAQGVEPLHCRDIPLEDPAAFELIQRMDTTAIFQLESDGMRKLIKRLRPDTFDDLTALVALFRPGPLQSGMVDDYIERKHGKARVEHLHPAIADILKPTWGVILYQEQVMQIAQVLAGYTLGAADLLRRAMGKKKAEEMAGMRESFVSGAVARGVPEFSAAHIFDLMEKFAGYGFNKSHSAAYALLAYQTAWLKAHHPAAFMAAVLSSDMDNTDKIVHLREEVRRMGVRLLAPSLNQSQYKFTVVDDATIRFGMGAVKGAGAAAVEGILGEREHGGAYADLFEFVRRIDTRKVNKRVLEALIRCGALDEFGQSRAVLMASLEKAMQLAAQHTANDSVGQDDMFGLGAVAGNAPGGGAPRVEITGYVAAENWGDHERLRAEKETLGFYLEGHPIARYETELSAIVTARLNQVRSGNARVAGYIEDIRIRSTSRGKLAEILLDDRTARTHMTLFSDEYQKYRNLINKDQLIIARGKVTEDDYCESGYSIVGEALCTLDQIRARSARLRLRIDEDQMRNGLADRLMAVVSRYRSGTCPVVVEYTGGRAGGMLSAGDTWKVTITDHLLDELGTALGQDCVVVEYTRPVTV